MSRTRPVVTAPSKKESGYSTGDKVGVALITGISLLLSAYGIIGGNMQDDSLNRTLTADATARIPGFQDFSGDVDGLTVFTDTGNIKVELDNGSTCDVQYTTYGKGILNQVFPNEARIVSYGTCPAPASVLAPAPNAG